MKVGILNSELGIVVMDSLDDLGYLQVQQLIRQIPKGVELNDLAFFYMADRDWIVLNQRHKLYRFYSEIIPTYLKLPENKRREVFAEAPRDGEKRALAILDKVILKRRLMSSMFRGKESATA